MKKKKNTTLANRLNVLASKLCPNDREQIYIYVSSSPNIAYKCIHYDVIVFFF